MSRRAGTAVAAYPAGSKLVRLPAAWQRKLQGEAMVHADQGCQFPCHDWQDFLHDHGLVSSMYRPGASTARPPRNTVDGSFFPLLERARVRRRTRDMRVAGWRDVVDYIETL